MKYLTSHAAGEHSIKLFSIAHALWYRSTKNSPSRVYKLDNPHAEKLRCAPNTSDYSNNSTKRT